MKIPDPKPETMVKFHLIMMVVWPILLIPTLIWWKQSILWIATMSLYANFVGHFSAYDAARGEVASKERDEEAAKESGGGA